MKFMGWFGGCGRVFAKTVQGLELMIQVTGNQLFEFSDGGCPSSCHSEILSQMGRFGRVTLAHSCRRGARASCGTLNLLSGQRP
jgi:hypothetical protein